MTDIQTQIKTGKISGKDLLNLFSSPGDHEKLYEELVRLLTPDPKMLATFALILYRSGNLELFANIYKELVKFKGVLGGDKNFLMCVSLYEFEKGIIYE